MWISGFYFLHEYKRLESYNSLRICTCVHLNNINTNTNNSACRRSVSLFSADEWDTQISQKCIKRILRIIPYTLHTSTRNYIFAFLKNVKQNTDALYMWDFLYCTSLDVHIHRFTFLLKWQQDYKKLPWTETLTTMLS